MLPTPLQPISDAICDWWNHHKGGAVTQRALTRQLTEFSRILADPNGGLSAITAQIEKAVVHHELSGKAWHGITYANFQAYGRPLASNGRYPQQADRPGPPLRRPIGLCPRTGVPLFAED